MGTTDLNSLSNKNLTDESTNILNVLNGIGDKSYQTAISQLFKVLGDGFGELSKAFQKTIQDIEKIEKTHSKAFDSFEKNGNAQALGKDLNDIALRKTEEILKANRLEGELKNHLKNSQQGQSPNDNTTSNEQKWTREERIYGKHLEKMYTLDAFYRSDMIELRKKKENASNDAEKEKYNEALKARSNSHQASLLQMMFENQEFSSVLEKDITQLSRRAQKNAIKESEKAIKKAREFLNKKRKNSEGVSPEIDTELENLEKKVDNAEDATNKAKENLKKINPPHDVQGDFKAISEGFKTAADAVRSFNAPLAESFEIVSGVAAGAADIAGGIAVMSTNPVQGVANVAKGVMGIVGTFSKRNAENIAAKKAHYLQLTEIYSKELEYNKLLRQRMDLNKKLNETTPEYFNRKSENLEKQQDDIEKEAEEVLAKLQQKEYVSELKFVHKTWFRKARTDKETASLAGFDYDEIEKLYVENKLEGEAKVLFERLKALKEEGANVDKMLKDLEQEMKQAWTGTTSETIVDSIAKGFMNGQRSAKDFADTFKDLMKNAVMQAVKMKYLEGPIQQWYEEFAQASDNGDLTQKKIEDLEKSFNAKIEAAVVELEQIEKITGQSFSKTPEVEATAQKGLAAMTQDSADELNGRFSALQMISHNIEMDVSTIRNDLYNAAFQWVEIAENTRYCRKLETMESDMKSMKNDINTMALKGIRILR